MKKIEIFTTIIGLALILLSIVNLIMHIELEYDNEALCIYIDYAISTLLVSGSTFTVGGLIMIISMHSNNNDFDHIVKKY